MNREIGTDSSEDHCTLAELVRDPLIGLLMHSDGVDRHSVELLFERIARERPSSAGQRGGARSSKTSQSASRLGARPDSC
jgi:hypothetical protein